MAATLLNFGASSIGLTEQVVYTVPANTTSMLLGCLVSNTLGAILPITVFVAKGTNKIHLAQNKRISVGDSVDVVNGKIVLVAGDTITVKCGKDNSADVLVSVAQGV
jgi:hypothetical protein